MRVRVRVRVRVGCGLGFSVGSRRGATVVRRLPPLGGGRGGQGVEKHKGEGQVLNLELN